MGSPPSSPNPDCFSFLAHPHPFGFYQLLGATVLPPLFPSSQERGPSPPGSSYGKRLPEPGLTRELPPTLPRARDGHPCPQAPRHFQECFAAGFFTLRAV